mmetsp:Transcript_6750/g.10856  ORF Transcript_6750/g.10856 Transcript_6750/m.10856 type:complete len:158 (-) Transcript_6750:891-1364(-)
MGCNVNGHGKWGPHLLEGKATGLILNHAYGINDAIELTVDGEQVQLLRLRNPWGKSEWNGAWSSVSKEIKKYKALLEVYIAGLPPDEQFDLDADDGTFLIPFTDWLDIFSTLFVNIDFPEDWTGVRFYSRWTMSNSGGLPKKYDKENLERFAHNPQF